MFEAGSSTDLGIPARIIMTNIKVSNTNTDAKLVIAGFNNPKSADVTPVFTVLAIYNGANAGIQRV